MAVPSLIRAARRSNLVANLLDPSTTGGRSCKFQEQVRLEILVEATDAISLDFGQGSVLLSAFSTPLEIKRLRFRSCARGGPSQRLSS